MRSPLLFLVCVSLFFSSSLRAQDFSNKGKEFWLAYSYHVGMVNGGGSPAMTLYLTSDVSTTYTVEVFGAAVVQTGNITAGQVITVVIPNSCFINGEGSFTNRAIRVTAEKPIVVYSFITRSAASAATLCLPVNVLGREYISSNFTQISNETNSNSYFTIVAVEDNTTVQITPSAGTKNGWVANTTYTINLNRGGIYQVLGSLRSGITDNPGSDLSGSKIQSVASGTGGCKRIAVFSGSGKISIGCTGNGAGSADNLYQQLYPVATWGKKYLTVPSYQRPNNYYRIFKGTAGGNVYLNGVLIPASSFTNGTYYQFSNNIPNRIEADQPVSVSQYFTSQGCDGNPTGNSASAHYDPDMIVLNPVEQNIDKVTLVNTALVNSPAQHHVHAIMRNTGTGLSSFKVDGANLPLTSWTVHPADPAYSYIYLSNVSQGYHRLESDSGFNAVVYGYANAESYGYSAGANVKDLYQFVSIQNQFATVNFPSTCTNAPFFFSMTFPYQPTEIRWVFGSALNAMGIADVTLTAPSYDSTFTVDGKQLYRYKLTMPHTITAVGTYPIKVFANSPSGDGCSGEQEINYDIQVFAAPTANFNFAATGCLTDSVRFTDASNTAGGRPSTKWFWDFADGSSSQIKNPAHLYTTPGSYEVKMAVVSDIGCLSDTAKKTVSVGPTPVAKFGIVAPYCVGKSVLFADSSTSVNSSIAKWTWNFGDGSAPVEATTNASQPHTFTNPGSYTVTLIVETAGGCKSTAFTKSINVAASPIVAFTFSKACLPNQLVQFANQSSLANGTQSDLSFQWSFGDRGNSPAINPAHQYAAAGPYSVLLVATSSAGCVDSIRKTVDSIYTQPQARFTAPAELCLGAVANFNSDASVAANSTVTAWVWSFGDGTQSTQKNPTHTYALAGSYEVTLIVTSAVGCVSAVWKETVIVNALPAVRFTTSSPTCVGKAISFTDVSQPGSGQVNSWTWSFGDGSPASTLQTPTHIYSSSGTYNVTLQVKTDKGCLSAQGQQAIQVSVNPKAGFILPGNCVNDPVSQFVDTSSMSDGSQSQFTYAWNFGDPNATTANPNTSTTSPGAHTYTATGNYNVQLIVTSNAGCKDTVSQQFTINGAVPVPAFTIQGGTEHCSNDSITFVDNSTVVPGKLVKLEIYWDYAGDPTIKTVVANPLPGTRYTHLYPEFFSPATKTYRVKYIVYSGVNCFTERDATITLKATPQISFPAITSICLDEAAVQLQANVANLPGGSFQYTGTGVSTTGLFDPKAAGAGTFQITYQYVAANGCSNQMMQPVTVNPVPTVNAGPDRFVLDGGSVTLAASATGSGLIYSWSPATYLNNSAVLQPTVTPKDDVSYMLTGTTANGCSASDQVSVKLLKTPTIPNAFTPNGDNVNDRWVIQYLDSYPGATVEIFNRYGSLIYRSVGYTNPWDGNYNGKPAPAGTYYYIINPKNGRGPLSGFVDIVR